MEEEKILENITKSISEKLKVPIILTYVCVLIIHNWDILFFLFFESAPASGKIQFIKDTYGKSYYERIFESLIIAIILIVLFTILNTGINFCMKWFYRKDKEILSEIESHEQIRVLSAQLSKAFEEIKNLNSQINNLKTINENLNSKNLDLKVSDISEKDYDSLLNVINTKVNKEKLLYSLKELIEKFKEKPKENRIIINKTSTYEAEMSELTTMLIDRNLIKIVRYSSSDGRSSYEGYELGASFKDFLKKQI